MPTYQELGYDSFFDNSIQTAGSQSIANIDAELLLQDIDASTLVANGAIKSKSSRVNMDLANDVFSVDDGTTERVRLGLLNSGEYGLQIIDQDGNVLMEISGSTNLLQSKTRKMQLDFEAEQARWYDDKNLRILIGKAAKLF